MLKSFIDSLEFGRSYFWLPIRFQGNVFSLITLINFFHYFIVSGLLDDTEKCSWMPAWYQGKTFTFILCQHIE